MSIQKSFINNKYIGYLFSFRELILLLIFYSAFFDIPFLRPDIAVTYDFCNYGLPVKLKAIIDSTVIDGPKYISGRFKSYQYTDGCCEIYIYNNTDKDIGINNFRINGAYDVTDVFVEASSHKLQKDLCCLWQYSIDKNNVLVFEKFDVLPAGTSVRYIIHGNFLPPLLEDFVDIDASAKSIRVEAMGSMSGFWYFISQNSFIPTIMLLLLFIGLGIKRAGGVR